ncbi:zinc finger protein [Macleaya cordata]|uniref:Zinc finger protein n=1 Tax=Macleaya cordata TaxID=56857 RepID=A0A200Q4E9_MACCD|nr:zinc finger protein [Macleaya cordata]
MTSHVVKVRRETLAACMTCPLCNKLLKEATTISECLHTFCRKCIYEKLTDEEVDCCPICNIDLGCVPVEKLRLDHNLQDVRAKIFPLKRRKVKAPEVMPTISLPVRRKERSLSSLVVSTPRVSTQTSLTGRRTKAVARKAAALRGSSFVIEEPGKKEEDALEERHESSSSPETLSKIAQNRRQSSSTAEPSNHHIPNKDKENVGESWAGKIDLWKPLNCLVEAANRTKSHKFSSQASTIKLELNNDPDSEVRVPKTKVREHVNKSKAQDEKTGTNITPLGMVKPRKFLRMGRKRAAASGELGVTGQAVLDAVGAKRDRRNSPIWFTLVASEDQEGDAPLPQISACYLRIKDSNIPVSFIQKYLVKKLDLTSEAEVEIRCHGQPVVPTLELHNLMDLWLQTATTSHRIPTPVGTTAKDFVMVLAYSRKVPALLKT